MYYYKAHYYDPETGRFLQTDPIGYEDQMNLYAYVANDPVGNIDITGLAMVSVRIKDDVVTKLKVLDDGDKYHTRLAINETYEFRNSLTGEVIIEQIEYPYSASTINGLPNRQSVVDEINEYLDMYAPKGGGEDWLLVHRIIYLIIKHLMSPKGMTERKKEKSVLVNVQLRLSHPKRVAYRAKRLATK